MEETPTTNHANKHISKFLALPDASESLTSSAVQIVDDGRKLTSEMLLKNAEISLTRPILVRDKPSSLGMKVLSFPRRSVVVRDVADIIGHHYPVHVIDVEHQEELDGWTITDLMEYFEDEERLLYQHKKEMEKIVNSEMKRSRRRRKAAENCISKNASRPRVLNQISLEFSNTPLMAKIASPKFVRDLDWIDHAWPGFADRGPNTIYPNVQYYCLTSAAGCYTDFHVDFGGTSVWYHILNGRKTFCLIAPTTENLETYEDWLCRPNQAELFLPEMIEDQSTVLRLTLAEARTLIIPSGWIHAVYTPVDSVVLGGNFLHGMDISMQLKVHCIETRTRVQEKFRFPHFLPLHFYAGGMYLKKLRQGNISEREAGSLEELVHVLEEWWNVHSLQSKSLSGPSVQGAAEHAATENGCPDVESFLKCLRAEFQRVQANGIGSSPITVTAPVSNDAVKSDRRPKIRLKLGSKYIASTAAFNQAEEKEDPITVPTKESKPGRLRINLSISARKAIDPIATGKRKKKREDIDWYVDESRDAGDGEWMPGSKNKKRELPKNSIEEKMIPAKVVVPKSKKMLKPSKPVSSRQRLSKRFR